MLNNLTKVKKRKDPLMWKKLPKQYGNYLKKKDKKMKTIKKKLTKKKEITADPKAKNKLTSKTKAKQCLTKKLNRKINKLLL